MLNKRSLVCVLIMFLFLISACSNKTAFANKRTKEMNKYPTIGELIASDSINENKWYWVEISDVNIDRDLASPEAPLREGHKAVVFPDDEYFSDPETSYKVAKGFSLKKIITPKGPLTVLSKEVFIHHIGKNIIPEQSFLDKIKVDSLQPGVHYFKEDTTGGISTIALGSVAFLKSYYRVIVPKSFNAKKTINYEKVRPLVAGYYIYDYYPSGYMKRRVIIFESGLFSPPRDGETSRPSPVADDRDKYIEYSFLDRHFNDKGFKQTKESSEVRNAVTDKTHSFWIQNILHD